MQQITQIKVSWRICREKKHICPGNVFCLLLRESFRVLCFCAWISACAANSLGTGFLAPTHTYLPSPSGSWSSYLAHLARLSASFLAHTRQKETKPPRSRHIMHWINNNEAFKRWEKEEPRHTTLHTTASNKYPDFPFINLSFTTPSTLLPSLPSSLVSLRPVYLPSLFIPALCLPLHSLIHPLQSLLALSHPFHTPSYPPVNSTSLLFFSPLLWPSDPLSPPLHPLSRPLRLLSSTIHILISGESSLTCSLLGAARLMGISFPPAGAPRKIRRWLDG